MNNPIEIIKSYMGKGIGPQQVINKLITNNTNPVISNLIQSAQKGDYKAVEAFAKNMYKEKGRDFDKEFSEFMKQFK